MHEAGPTVPEDRYARFASEITKNKNRAIEV
jgi:hypothetical protein